MADHFFWQDKKVLITGGSGFIGSHLTQTLINFGCHVTIIDKIPPTNLPLKGKENGFIRFEEVDLAHFSWKPLLLNEQYNALFHLAGNANVSLSVQKPNMDYETNLGYTFKMLEAMREIGWGGVLIYPSSAAVYGNPITLPISEMDSTIPISPYGVSKLAAERYIAVYSHLYGLRTASLRPFSIYGPNQRKQVVYDLIQKILASPNAIEIYGDGSQTRDFLFVSDLIEASLLVVEKGKLQGETYNVASGQERSILNVVETICGLLDIHPRYSFTGAVRPGEPERWAVNIERLQQLGFTSTVRFEDGILEVIKWCIDGGKNMKRKRKINYHLRLV